MLRRPISTCAGSVPAALHRHLVGAHAQILDLSFSPPFRILRGAAFTSGARRISRSTTSSASVSPKVVAERWIVPLESRVRISSSNGKTSRCPSQLVVSRPTSSARSDGPCFRAASLTAGDPAPTPRETEIFKRVASAPRWTRLTDHHLGIRHLGVDDSPRQLSPKFPSPGPGCLQVEGTAPAFRPTSLRWLAIVTPGLPPLRGGETSHPRASPAIAA